MSVFQQYKYNTKPCFLQIFFHFFTSNSRYNISPTGSNSNDGSIGSPWLTLSYACSHAVASVDIIHVNGGTYIETTKCALKEGVSIEGEGNTSCIISHYTAAGENDALICLYSASVTDGNQSISYIKLDGGSLKGNRGIYTMNRNNVQIPHCTFVCFKESGVTFDGYGRWAELTEPAIYLTGNGFHNNTVTNCSNSIVNVLSNAAMYAIGQQGFLLHNNTITSGRRASGMNGELVGVGNSKGHLCYDNMFNSPLENAGYSDSPWCSALEVTYQKAVAHYNNINIWNNVICGNTPNSYAGISYNVFNTHTNVKF